MLRAMLLKLFFQVLFFLKTFPLRAKQFFQIKLLGSHKTYVNITPDLKPKLGGNLAIVAIYPRPFTLRSTLRLLQFLHSADYSVICVVNSSRYNDHFIEEISKKNVVVLLRKNIGRDFGAYKLGVDYAHSISNENNYKRILFANDSIYYFPNTRNCIQSFLKKTSPWTALYVNFERRFHAQSFFFTVDKSIFYARWFRKFWKSYYPSDIRHRVIEKGEIDLTKIITSKGFLPENYTTAEMILRHRNFKNFTSGELFALWGPEKFQKPGFEESKFQLRRIFTILNVTHYAGLISQRVLGMPLKLDLLQSGLYNLDDLVENARSAGLHGVELDEYVKLISTKGSAASYSGLRKLFRNSGFID
jgi:hypothetical protein